MKPISSLIKALDTLSLLSSEDRGFRLPELTEAMNLPRSTLIRTLNTLILYGLVDREGKQYRCGPTFDRWSHRNRRINLAHRYRSILEFLFQKTHELVLLGLHEGNGIIHIDYIESDQWVRVAPAPYTRHSMKVNALGKLALSRRADLMAQIAEPNLRKELEEIQRTGVAWNREESVPGMIAMATPGFTNSPTEPMIAVAWPASRFTEEKGRIALQEIRNALSENTCRYPV